MDQDGQPTGYRLPSEGHLVAYNADDLKVLYDSATNPADAFGGFMKFANPTVANGKVFVPSASNALAVYGLNSIAPGAQPVVTAVVNAASYGGGAIAPGEIVAVLGQNLGGATLVSSAFDETDQLPSQVVGTQVTFNGIPAPLLYSSASAVAAIVPYELSGATTAAIQVSANGRLSAAQTIQVQPALPGIFTADASGVGPGAILNLDYSVNSTDNPAAAGDIVIVYATGAATDKARTGRRATEADRVSGPVSAFVNGQPAEVLYAGAAPGLVYGALQVNLRLPKGLTGDLTIVLNISGQSSPATVIVSVK